MIKSFRKQKLLLVITEDWYFISHRLPIARAARDAGFDVMVATHVTDHGGCITQEAIKLIPLGLRRNGRNPLRELSSIIELISIYKRERPDIVHHVAMKPVLYGTIAARVTKIPFVVNALGGLGYVFISNQFQAKILRLFISMAFKLILNNKNSQLIIQNQDDIQLLVASHTVSRERIALIKGSGVDTDKFIPVPECTGETIVVLVARMLWDKGVKEFVDAAELLIKKGKKARFVLVGKNDPENPASIPTGILNEWNDQGYVEWWGFKEDIREVFEKSHIVCLPSYREGLPKVLIEAASCGRPIVTTNTPGCREIVRDGENGFLVPARNVEALANAMSNLIDDPLLRKKMGTKGREIAANEFSVDGVIFATLAIYDRLLSDRAT